MKVFIGIQLEQYKSVNVLIGDIGIEKLTSLIQKGKKKDCCEKFILFVGVSL